MKEWQKGHPLERLQWISTTFKERHKAHVYGAFGLIKERDVADALTKGRCSWLRATQPEQYPPAVCIWQPVGSRGKRVKDFRGETFNVPPGSLYISAFAALSAQAGTDLLQQFKARANSRLYVEVFEEDETARQSVEGIGLKWQATKVSAGSEIKGVYGSRQAFDLSREEAAVLVACKAPYLQRTELVALQDEIKEAAPWAQHYSGYNKRQSWTAFALRGFDGSDPSFIIKPAEMSRKWQKENPQRGAARPAWTALASAFPMALSIARRFVDSDEEIDRLRFMRLSPEKGELARHADITDREAGVADGKIARLHIPVFSSDRVRVFGWTHRGEMIERKFAEGGLYYLDQRKPHRVLNEGGKERVHLVADVRSSEKVRKWLR